jgi:hypothetical protein
MHHRLDPSAFVGQPLHLHKIGDGDYRVTIRGHTAGRLLRTMRGGNQQVWLWTLTGPYCVAARLGTSGESDHVVTAKLALRACFDAWLAWAIRQNGDVVWHE